MFRWVISRMLSAEAHSHGTENTKQCNRESNSKIKKFGGYGKLDQVSLDCWRVSGISQDLFFLMLRCWKLSLGLMCARQVLYHCMPSLSPWFLRTLVFETGACEITHTGLKLTLFLRQLWNCLGHLCGWVCATRPDPGDLIYGGDRSTRAKIWMDHNPYVNGLSFLRLRIRNDRRGAIEPTASRVLTHLHRSVVPSSVTSQSQRLGQGGKRFHSFVVYCRNPAKTQQLYTASIYSFCPTLWMSHLHILGYLCPQNLHYYIMTTTGF